MAIIESLLILIALVVCFYACKTDLQHGIIKNKLLFSALIPIIILDVIYYGLFVRDTFVEFILNVFVISLFTILFYAIHVWGAGDSKMAIILALATPARLYHYFNNEATPLLAFLIYTFSFGYIYLLIHSITCLLKKRTSFKSNDDKPHVLRFIKDYLIGLVYITFLANLFNRFIPEFFYDNQLLFLFINIFWIMLVFSSPVFQNKWLIAVVAVCTVILSISIGQLLFNKDLRVYVIILVLYLLRELISLYNYESIDYKALKPGMILSATSVAMMLPSNIQGLPSNFSEDLSARINADEIIAVNKWFAKHRTFTTVIIVTKIPFALFISIGYVFYMILGLFL